MKLFRGNVPQSSISSKNIRSVNALIYSFSGDGVADLYCQCFNQGGRNGFHNGLMNIDLPYNAILDKNWLNEMKAVPSSFHQKLISFSE